MSYIRDSEPDGVLVPDPRPRRKFVITEPSEIIGETIPDVCDKMVLGIPVGEIAILTSGACK